MKPQMNMEDMDKTKKIICVFRVQLWLLIP